MIRELVVLRLDLVAIRIERPANRRFRRIRGPVDLRLCREARECYLRLGNRRAFHNLAAHAADHAWRPLDRNCPHNARRVERLVVGIRLSPDRHVDVIRNENCFTIFVRYAIDHIERFSIACRRRQNDLLDEVAERINLGRCRLGELHNRIGREPKRHSRLVGHQQLTGEGYTVRILGEGSNGGTITYPSSVRDPLNTIFAIIKLLLMRENGLYEMYCNKAGIKYNPDFTLTDILASLPVYTTTGVSEPRAITHVKNTDHAKLKASFQKVFEKEWSSKKAQLKKDYGIADWEAVITNGTKETRDVKDFSLSGKGGLKIIFKNEKKEPVAFIWMRGSGTEPVFRIMCDVKGNNIEMEKSLLEWETQMLEKADK